MKNIFMGIRKIAKSDYKLHVLLSVRMEKLGSQGTDFNEI
jgi:hypothetical protein